MLQRGGLSSDLRCTGAHEVMRRGAGILAHTMCVLVHAIQHSIHLRCFVCRRGGLAGRSTNQLLNHPLLRYIGSIQRQICATQWRLKPAQRSSLHLGLGADAKATACHYYRY